MKKINELSDFAELKPSEQKKIMKKVIKGACELQRKIIQQAKTKAPSPE